MNNCKVEKIDGRWVLYNPEMMPSPQQQYFSCGQLKQRGLVVGSAGGRGETCFYKAEGSIWALRHYLRGGLIARFLSDQYFGLQLKNTRAWKEWHLLNEMTALGLPVPKPVAASVIKQSLFYRADLVTEYIEKTQTLAEWLETEDISDHSWESIGACVRRFHDEGVYHSDLNAKNILIADKQTIYLIDFDQCRFRQGNEWKAKNLSRLKRSLLKFSNKLESFNFNETNWVSLLNAYNQV